MMNKKQFFLYGTFGVTALACLCLMLSGCSKNETVPIEDPHSDMSPDLRKLQGSWVNISTNDTMQCTAIIQDYTMRIRYQNSPDQPLQKQNKSIERIDEDRNLIIINGGTGAYPFTFLSDESLMLEFFASDGWHNMHLCRSN